MAETDLNLGTKEDTCCQQLESYRGGWGQLGLRAEWCQVSPMPSSTQADLILPVELIFEAKTKVSESFWGHVTPAPQLERFSFSQL